jgi:hypothetical protein
MAISLLVLMPLLIGLSVIGTNLVRSLRVNQFCRDVAHMYAYGVDFAKAGNQVLLTNLSQGLNVTTSGGEGAVLLSVVTYVSETDCQAAGLAANTTSCPNLHKAVVVTRIRVGNPDKLISHFATPTRSIIGSEGKIAPRDYLRDQSVRAQGFTDLMTLSSGQYAYLTEVYVAANDLAWPGVMDSPGTYAYNIF